MKPLRSRTVSCAVFASASLALWGLARAGDPPTSPEKEKPANDLTSDKFEKPKCEFIKSPNITEAQRGKGKINYIIIHTVEGSTKSAINIFLDANPGRRVSAHYIVGKDGRVVQMVQDKDQAWHAGVKLYNEEAIGIEHEGFAGKNGWTEVQVRTSAKLSRWLCHEYGITIDRKHILGHQEIAPKRKSDPGPYFDWDLYLKLIKDPKTKVDLSAPKKVEEEPKTAPSSDDSKGEPKKSEPEKSDKPDEGKPEKSEPEKSGSSEAPKKTDDAQPGDKPAKPE